MENSKVTLRDSNIIRKCVSYIQKAYEWLKIGGICNECTNYTVSCVNVCACILTPRHSVQDMQEKTHVHKL